MSTSKTIILIVVFLNLANNLSAGGELPDSILGNWTGKGNLHLPLAKKIPLSDVPEDNPQIDINISKDGTVTGHVGNAILRNCIITKNRGWFGRLLNIKTDFIIKEGYLEGKICPGDTVNQKQFTLPFNIHRGQLVGTIMQIHKWKYPDPLVRVKLNKVQKHCER